MRHIILSLSLLFLFACDNIKVGMDNTLYLEDALQCQQKYSNQEGELHLDWTHCYELDLPSGDLKYVEQPKLTLTIAFPNEVWHKIWAHLVKVGAVHYKVAKVFTINGLLDKELYKLNTEIH